jgi:hypothetical protein
MKRWLSLLAASLACGGCVWSGCHVSRDLVELARQTRTGGEFVIEVAEDGQVINADAQVELSSVPKAVLEAAERELPGPAVDAEREIAIGVRYWEIEKKVDGRTIELMIDDACKLLGKEEELAKANWPEAIVKAANQAVPEGQITTVELVTGPEALGGTEYHVKKDLGKEILRISVLKDGTVTRYVRKIRGEFKPPR